ncbi:uncharacterized protein LOC127279036 [Leptopilina boulardi]|uniref:uncharacterized protein LOC127279036 n=1 Tax=Leptopilina boulardi TaxID=63433 RepID=UPI0021F63B7C|nr:uncharacterized protein LOC127279036 [Leptopilina boulardi]
METLIDDYQTKCLNRNQENVCDLTSATEFRRLKVSAIPGKNDVFLIWFTDGVQVSKSGKSNMWPIYAQVVNIDPQFRRSFQFVCGIFYMNRSSKKPNMNAFLRPFATTLTKLQFDGFQWRSKLLNRIVTSKVVAPVASLDAPAKSATQNVMQYNGENSCPSCEATGESCQTGGGFNWIFPVTHEEPPLRTAERMENQTKVVEKHKRLKHFKGVKGASIVTSIPFFDRSRGFVADYMHAVLLGVHLMILNLWCDSKNHEKSYYLNKGKRDEIDEILQSIMPPDDVTRTPRKLSNISDWKASELRAFLLYYGPVILKNRLDDECYDHYLLLVRGIYLLSQEEITPTELNLADTLLHLFVIDVERHYGRNKCSYNVHQLLHLTSFVRMWGPLWVWSAFSSEDNNGELVRMVHGSNKIDVELSNTIKIVQAYRSIQFMMNPQRQRNHIKCLSHGPSIRYDITNNERKAITQALNITEEELRTANVKIFSRCVINDEIFTSILYTRQKKRANFYVQWKNEETVLFGAVKFFFKVETNLYVILRQLINSNDKNHEINNKELEFNLNRHLIHVHDSYCIHAIDAQKISKILRVQDYICIFPNNREKK